MHSGGDRAFVFLATRRERFLCQSSPAVTRDTARQPAWSSRQHRDRQWPVPRWEMYAPYLGRACISEWLMRILVGRPWTYSASRLWPSVNLSTPCSRQKPLEETAKYCQNKSICAELMTQNDLSRWECLYYVNDSTLFGRIPTDTICSSWERQEDIAENYSLGFE